MNYRFYNASGTLIYSATFTYLVIPDLPINTYYIQNAATNKYMDVEGPSTAEGAYIQQWGFSTAEQKRWLLFPEPGGYYTIYSMYSDLCVGVTSSSQTAIKQYSSENDYTKWYFHETEDGRYAIANKAWSSVMKVIAAPSDTGGNGADLTLTTYTGDTSLRDEWKIYENNYYLIIDNRYDEGYNVRFSTSTQTASEAIQLYNEQLQTIYLRIFGLATTYTVQKDISSADECVLDRDGSINGNNILQELVCSHGSTDETSHSTRTAIRNSMEVFGSCTETVVAWTGHILPGNPPSVFFSTCEIVMTPNGLIYYVSATSEYCNSTQSTIYNNSILALLHEVSHSLGTRDHYCTQTSTQACDQRYCDIHQYNRPQVRTCVMGYYYNLNIATTPDSDLICNECRQRIIEHLELYH